MRKPTPYLILLIALVTWGCTDRPPASGVPATVAPSTASSATAVIEVSWSWKFENGLGISRSVNVGGQLVSGSADPHMVSCFGAQPSSEQCQNIGLATTTPLLTPGPVWNGAVTQVVQPGTWSIVARAVNGDKASGSAISVTSCGVTVQPGQFAEVDLTFGFGAATCNLK